MVILLQSLFFFAVLLMAFETVTKSSVWDVDADAAGSLKFSKLQSKFKSKVVFNCVVLSS